MRSFVDETCKLVRLFMLCHLTGSVLWPCKLKPNEKFLEKKGLLCSFYIVARQQFYKMIKNAKWHWALFKSL